MTTYLSTLNG